MILHSIATSWLLLSSVSARPFSGPVTLNDREEYWRHAKNHGMCIEHDTRENLNRNLVVPGDDVLASFDVCVAKNEFGERLHDTSGTIFCSGRLIHLMADARNHNDSKEFVDQATTRSGLDVNVELNHTIEAHAGKLKVSHFLDNVVGNFSFKKPGEELHDYVNPRFPSTPVFVDRIRPQARLFSAWSKIVHHYWNKLDRVMIQEHQGYLIPGPGSVIENSEEKYSTSLIRLDHPFVVAGGRFREQYYWDSYFIMKGLLAANVTHLARTMLLNFMDEIKAYGFIPNGGRKYYLNRSQPPLFISMLYAYTNATGDMQILHEALPLAERELRWWNNNRSVRVSHGGNSYRVFQYNVKATGPRPESYAEDWRSVWCHSEGRPPTKDEEKEFYSEFASGAETGWDYTARWMSENFTQAGDDKSEQMRYLRVRDIIPVDLNSILYRSHKLMAHLYQHASTNESPFATEYSHRHEKLAEELRKAILALNWDSNNLSFFDFVLDKKENSGGKTGNIYRFWSGASMVPYWAEIWPYEFEDCTLDTTKKNVMQAFTGIRDILEMYPGPLPSTLVKTGQQWDFPNSWPPLQYFAIQALENLNDVCIDKTTSVEFFDATQNPRPLEHLGRQKPHSASPGVSRVDYSITPSWRDVLVKTVVVRYMNAAYCTWNNEGKFPSDRVEIVVRDNPRLDSTLADHPGNMYEKLDATSATQPGSGGEYHVQTGFGWTNGVALWIAQNYGAILNNPDCGNPDMPAPTAPANVEQERDQAVLFQT